MPARVIDCPYIASSVMLEQRAHDRHDQRRPTTDGDPAMRMVIVGCPIRPSARSRRSGGCRPARRRILRRVLGDRGRRSPVSVADAQHCVTAKRRTRIFLGERASMKRRPLRTCSCTCSTAAAWRGSRMMSRRIFEAVSAATPFSTR